MSHLIAVHSLDNINSHDQKENKKHSSKYSQDNEEYISTRVFLVPKGNDGISVVTIPKSNQDNLTIGIDVNVILGISLGNSVFAPIGDIVHPACILSCPLLELYEACNTCYGRFIVKSEFFICGWNAE